MKLCVLERQIIAISIGGRRSSGGRLAPSTKLGHAFALSRKSKADNELTYECLFRICCSDLPYMSDYRRPCNFFYNVTGEEAERLLRQYGSDGEFLARPSESQPLNFTLSIIRGKAITHVKIQKNSDDFLDLFGGESFASLSELVQFYIDNPEQLQERNGESIIMKRPVSIPLYEPAAQEARAPASQRWFHANITGTEAVDLLSKEKQWTYLVRESQRAPGSYAITVKTTDDHVVHILIQKKADTGMYHVGGGDEFRTVSELLAHYNNNPMVEEGSQRVVHLMNLVPSTCVPADAIDERIRLLEEIDPVTKKSGFLEEFERIQQVDDQFSSRREGKKEQNVSRNRYKNIVPFDHTRVILKDVPPNESDYINASYIRIPKGPPLHLYANREYISTQGCLPNTLLDFWRMVWQENSRVIVMTTKEMERSRSKCHVYWPALREELNLREYVIKTVEEIKVPGDNGLDMFIKRRFMVAKKGMPQREVFHLQFIGWPDHGCPEQPESVLRFLDAVDVACKKAISSQGPVIVHCSAGIGRTGTFIVIDILLNQIRHRGSSCPIDIPRTVMKIREQRSRMVQTEAQYVFLYRAISCYVGMINRSRHPSDDAGDGGQPLHLPPPPLPRRRTAPDVAQAYCRVLIDLNCDALKLKTGIDG
ncbi:Protein-tyrosine phosphatase [Ancylostoma ceylanicum]|uniref:protein-tyrosine-phosphatase n=1 Tax=Ancylostoma ceylanicum TaxID=53326 RepID=A0A0D6MAP7_9BILA|nr:Protein-tyrosine phosphatase [Ancylostoma ceylanicum]